MNPCIKRARDGDSRAREALVEHLRPRISKMAAYYGRCCGEDADDLLQEAWIGLLEALPELDLGIGSPEQHLIARARWRLLDAVKYARVRRCISLEDRPPEAARMSEPETALGAAWVSEFIHHLSLTQRAVLTCLLAGLTWREAGQVLGCTSANVAYHVRQIRRRLKEWMDEPPVDPEIGGTAG